MKCEACTGFLPIGVGVWVAYCIEGKHTTNQVLTGIGIEAKQIERASLKNEAKIAVHDVMQG